jgi:hypothetical protein
MTYFRRHVAYSVLTGHQTRWASGHF